MCYKCVTAEMVGVHAGHLPLLVETSHAGEDIVSDLHTALTRDLHPHLPALTALVAMVEAVEQKDFGILGTHNLIRLPLSVIGNNQIRYRTQMVEWLHESILSMRMSELTIEAIRQALRPHNLCITFLCSCGVVMGRCDDVRAYYGSDEHRQMDRLRSAIDAAGNPIVSIESFDDIPVPTMDLYNNGAEHRLFERIATLTKTISVAPRQEDYHWVSAELQTFVARTQSHTIAA